VRFGKLGVIRSKEKLVDIEINGEKVEDLHLILGEAGEAFFVEKIVTDIDGTEYVTSCDLSNLSSTELSAIIAAASNATSTTNVKIPTIETPSSPSSSLLMSTAKSVENLATEKLINETAKLKINNSKSVLSSSVSSIDLAIKNNGSPEKTITISRESTPQKSQPIPISPSKLLSVSSTPLTINTSTASISPLLVSPDTTVKSNIDSGTTAANNITTGNSKSHNFFSDGEITPELTSPAVSRPPTPKSDTELEVFKIKRSQTNSDIQWNWPWGELPSRQNNSLAKFVDSSISPDVAATSPSENQQKKSLTINANQESSAKSPSKLLGMFNLMSKSTTSPTATNEGIYLDETEKLDSEVAALYLNQKSNSKFPTNKPQNLQLSKDDDQESGNGQSLPQSPLRDYYSVIGDVQISLCGFVFFNTGESQQSQQIDTSSSSSLLAINQNSLPTFHLTLAELNAAPQNLADNQLQLQQMNFEDLFQQYAVSYEKFLEEFNTITMNPNLIVKINNKYMTWLNAAPVILSSVVFHKHLSTDLVNTLIETNNNNNNAGTVNKPIKQQESILQQPQQPQLSDKKSTSNSSGVWGKLFGVKSSTTTESSQQQPTTLTTISAIQKQTTTTTTTTTVTTTVQTNLVAAIATAANTDTDNELLFDSDLMTPNQFGETGLHQENNEIRDSSNENSLNNEKNIDQYNQEQQPAVQQFKYHKTTRLSSDLIMKLNLQPGSNEIVFSVTTALQGTTKITSNIFLWNYDDKVIVSDIDGTITKSDVWGQVLPIFGRDWSQAGVADLFTAIERNQYKFMYLSARAIGQSKITRDLLRSINQNGFTLPEGPLLVTPSSLFTAFQKEVIEKKPEEFKISCLKDIQSLFPSHNPYHAGYGNKTSDVKSYKTVGIPESRIFTINPQGEVKHEVSGAFQSSYSKLCDYVDLIFPPFKSSLEIKSEYDSFNYWRDTTSSKIMDEIEKEIQEAMLKEQKEAKEKEKAKTQHKVTKNNVKAKTSSPAVSLALTPSKNGSTNTIEQN
jgi:phosphatidate phosphatase LPIN